MRGEEVAERELEPLEVVRAPRPREVELVSDLVGTVDDEDVGDPVALEGGEDGVGVERRVPPPFALVLIRAQRSCSTRRSGERSTFLPRRVSDALSRA